MKRSIKYIALPISLLISATTFANQFTLSSNDITAGEFMPKALEFKGFGCDGDNRSPQLSWSGAPEGTEAFALLVHDPDAPTGSGWWHWQVINIPKNVTTLPANAGFNTNTLIPESLSIKNDYGVKGFGGACPPIGHGVHRYQFSLHALSKKLELPQDASPALASYLVRANTIQSVTLEALYKRN